MYFKVRGEEHQYVGNLIMTELFEKDLGLQF